MVILHEAREYQGEGPMIWLGGVVDDFGNLIIIKDPAWGRALHFIAQRVEG